jgi:hypothetical protein
VAAQVPPENAPVANPGEHAAGLAHARVVSEFTMTPVGPLATVTGSGALLRAGSQRTLVVRLKAPRRRAGSSYAVWLTGHGRPKLLGFVPPARAAGTFAGDTALPAHTARFKTVLITVERNQSPTRPGARVLRAALSLPLSRP